MFLAFLNTEFLKLLRENISMSKRFITALFASALTLGAASAAQATVLTFDELGGSTTPIPNGYGGLGWSNMNYLDAAGYQSTPNGYLYGMVSANNVAYNAYGNMAVTSGSLFDFNGAYFTGAWNNGLNINLLGYNNSVLLYNQTIVVSSNAPTWFQLDYMGINELRFISYGGVWAGYSGSGYQFAMDNFTFNEPQQPVATPEPGTIALVGAGLVGLGYWRRRASKKKALEEEGLIRLSVKEKGPVHCTGPLLFRNMNRAYPTCCQRRPLRPNPSMQ